MGEEAQNEKIIFDTNNCTGQKVLYLWAQSQD